MGQEGKAAKFESPRPSAQTIKLVAFYLDLIWISKSFEVLVIGNKIIRKTRFNQLHKFSVESSEQEMILAETEASVIQHDSFGEFRTLEMNFRFFVDFRYSIHHESVSGSIA